MLVDLFKLRLNIVQRYLIVTCCAVLYSSTAISDTLDALIIEAMQTHPAVLSSLESIEAAELNLKSARWQYYPTPSVSLSQVQASDSDSSYQGDDVSWTVSLSQPLYTGGRLKAGVLRAESGVSIAEIDLYESQQSLALRLVQAYGNWLSAYLKRIAWEKSRASHERLKKQVDRRVEAGLSPASDLALALGRYENTLAEIATYKAEQSVAINNIIEIVGREINIEDLEKNAQKVRIKDGGQLDELLVSVHLVSPAIRRAKYEIEEINANIQLQKSALRPTIELRAERQDGNLTQSVSGVDNRIFFNVNSQLGPGVINTC